MLKNNIKILLINPISNIAIDGSQYRFAIAFIAPIDLAYLSASLLKLGKFDVEVEDQFSSTHSNEYIINKIRQVKPGIVSFSCQTPALPRIRRLSKLIIGEYVKNPIKIDFSDIDKVDIVIKNRKD